MNKKETNERKTAALNAVLTLDDEAEAKAAKWQESKDRLFLWLPQIVTFSIAAVQLEGQGKLGGLNTLFDLKREQI